MYIPRKRDKHKKSHTRHPNKKDSLITKTQVLPVITDKMANELEYQSLITKQIEEQNVDVQEVKKDNLAKDELVETGISATSDDISTNEKEEKKGFTGRIAVIAKNQTQKHKEEVEERNQRLQQAKQEKINQTQNLKLQKEKLKETKQAVKDAKKEFKKVKNENKWLISTIVITIIALVSSILFFTVRWLFKTWPNLQMSELVYQITAPLEGTGSSQITNYIIQAVIPTTITMIIVIAVLFVISKASIEVQKLGKRIILVIFGLCIVLASFRFYTKLDLGNYISSQKNSSDFIKNNYVDPANTDINFPENKRNLVMIYLESMEMTYSDYDNGGSFDANYIPNLTNISESNENFAGGQGLNGAHSLPYTTWTMGGLFASTSGLPLQIDIEGNSMDTQSSFFPGITTLGDILSAQGYNNYFACGSDATFGGRRLYFESHGNYTIHDINYRKENGQLDQDYYVWWGFEDSKLIEWAKEDLTSLAESDEPFNYTMLTVDTHFEDGYYCEQCEDLWSGNQYANVISCSDKQVSKLISWIQEQSWYENTTIVITGDHPTMDSDFCESVSEDYERRVYTSYINAQPVEYNTSGYRTYSTFDTFPTVLSALGVEIVGNKLGLGTNLFSGTPTLTEVVGLQTESDEISRKSEFMTELSNIDIDNAEARERSGLSASATVNLESYEDGVATFTLTDLAHVVGNLERIEMTLSDSDGNVETKNFEYQGAGVFEVQMSIPNGNIDTVYLKTEVVSLKEEDERREVLYEYYGPLWLMSAYSGSLSSYLEDLTNLDLNHYTIFMTTQGDATNGIGEEERKQFAYLGASSLIDGGGNASFTIIQSSGIYARSRNGYIRDNGNLDNGIPYAIASSFDELQTSSILIGWNYDEYCPQQNGINIVIYDNYSNEVVSITSFDTTSSVSPSGTLSTETSLLTNNVKLVLSNTNDLDEVTSIIAVIYDPTDASKTEEVTMTLNDNNQYECTLKNYKKIIIEYTIKVFAEYDDYSRKYIGTLETDD